MMIRRILLITLFLLVHFQNAYSQSVESEAKSKAIQIAYTFQSFIDSYPLKSKSTRLKGPGIAYIVRGTNFENAIELVDVIWKRSDKYQKFVWQYGGEIRHHISKQILERKRLTFSCGISETFHFHKKELQYRNATANRYYTFSYFNIDFVAGVYPKLNAHWDLVVMLPINLFKADYYNVEGEDSRSIYTLEEQGYDFKMLSGKIFELRFGVKYKF